MSMLPYHSRACFEVARSRIHACFQVWLVLVLVLVLVPERYLPCDIGIVYPQDLTPPLPSLIPFSRRARNLDAFLQSGS